MTSALDLSTTIGASSAARILGVSNTHLTRLVDAGKLRPLVTPIGRLYDRDDVDRLAAERAADRG